MKEVYTDKLMGLIPWYTLATNSGVSNSLNQYISIEKA